MALFPDRSLGLAPASVRDYRELARRRLPRQLFDYIDGGAYEESTLRANIDDLAAIHLRQRVLRDVSELQLATTVLGQPLAMPLVLGPVGLAGMYAQRAEVQAAQAAEQMGIAFCESTVSICSIEEVDRATSAAVLVPALRHARPGLRRGPDVPCVRCRLSGVGAHCRPRGRGCPLPGGAQRHGGTPASAGPCRPGPRLRPAPALGP